jgi:hypothetical protein
MEISKLKIQSTIRQSWAFNIKYLVQIFFETSNKGGFGWKLARTDDVF